VDGLLEEDPAARILILGDLNDYPTDPAVKEVLRANAHPMYDTGELLNLSFNPHYRGQGSHVHDGDWGMLDHIIVSHGLAHPEAGLKLLSQEVNILNEEWLLYRNRRKNQVKPSRTYAGKKYHGGFSDHLPVYIELSV
jgi:predicted extracellular nuclease